MLDLGPTEQDIAKQAIRSGQPIPERIANAPQLQIGELFYLQAFFDLDAERSQGMGKGRIPWTAIMHYAAFYGLTSEQAELLAYYMRAMDTAYLKRSADNA